MNNYYQSGTWTHTVELDPTESPDQCTYGIHHVDLIAQDFSPTLTVLSGHTVSWRISDVAPDQRTRHGGTTQFLFTSKDANGCTQELPLTVEVCTLQSYDRPMDKMNGSRTTIDLSEDSDFSVVLRSASWASEDNFDKCPTIDQEFSGSFEENFGSVMSVVPQNSYHLITVVIERSFLQLGSYVLTNTVHCPTCGLTWTLDLNIDVIDCRLHSVGFNAQATPEDQTITLTTSEDTAWVFWSGFTYGTTDCIVDKYVVSCVNDVQDSFCTEGTYFSTNQAQKKIVMKTGYFRDQRAVTSTFTFGIRGYKESALSSNVQLTLEDIAEQTFRVTVENRCLGTELSAPLNPQTFPIYSAVNSTKSSTSDKIEHVMKFENWYPIQTPAFSEPAHCSVAYSFIDPDTGAEKSYDHISLVAGDNGSLAVRIFYQQNEITSLSQLKIRAWVEQAPDRTHEWTIGVSLSPNCLRGEVQQEVHDDESQYPVIVVGSQEVYTYTWQPFDLRDPIDDAICKQQGVIYELKLYCNSSPGCLENIHSLFSVAEDPASRKVTATLILPQRDSNVIVRKDGSVRCNLGEFATTECLFAFTINAMSVISGHKMGKAGHVRLTLKTQCWNIPSDQSTQGWFELSASDQLKMEDGYQIRSSALRIQFPAIVPNVLESGQDVFNYCGDITYGWNPISDGTESVATFVQPPTSLIRENGPTLIIETDMESLVVKEDGYKREQTFQLTAWFLTSSDYVFTHPETFTFTVKDLCIEITFDEMPPVIISNAHSTLKTWQQDSKYIYIEKPAKSDPTFIQVPPIAYKPYGMAEPSTVCGPLIVEKVQSNHQSFEILNSVPELGDEDISLKLEAAPDDMVGELPFFQLRIRPSNFGGQNNEMILVDFHVTVTPCQTFAIDFSDNNFGTVQMRLNDQIQLPFNPFVAKPDCGYSEKYSVTVSELDSWDSRLPATHKEAIGTQPVPGLVNVDYQKTRLIFDPQGKLTLIEKAFAIYVGIKVGEGETAYYNHMPPIRLVFESANYTPMNTAPFIEDFASIIEVEPLNATTVSVGRIVDIEEDPFYVESFSIEHKDATRQAEDTSWVKFLNSTSQEELLFFVNATEESVGSQLTIKITLADKNEILPQNQAFVISLIVVEPTLKEEDIDDLNGLQHDQASLSVNLRQKYLSDLKVEIQEPSAEGLFKISFSRSVKVPAQARQWSSYNEGSFMLQITYLPSEETTEKLNGYRLPITKLSWSIRGMQLDSLQARRELQSGIEEVSSIWVQMAFSDPLLVSNFDTRDKIAIKLFASLFEAELGDSTSEMDVAVDVEFPLQPQQEVGMQQTIESVATASQGAITATISLSLLVNIFLAGLLQYMWGFVNTLQIIVLTVLFTVQQPVNSQSVLISVMNLINFDILHTELLLRRLIHFRASNEPLNEKFEIAGYQTSNFILGLGNILLLILGALVLLIAKMLLQACTRKCRETWLTRKLRAPVHIVLITVRFLLEGSVELGIVSMLAIRDFQADDFAHGWDVVSSCGAIFTLACLVTVPFYLGAAAYRFLHTKESLSTSNVETYRALFEVYKEGDSYAIAYGVIFFLRRYFIVVLLVLFPERQYTQICCQLSSTLVMMMYLGYFSPYELGLHNKQELANEVLATYASYHLYVFTDWVGSKQRQWEAGWSLIGVILFCVLFNFAIILWQAVRKALLDLRRRKVRRRMREQMEKHLEQQVAQYLKAGAPERDASVNLVKLKQRQKPHFFMTSSTPKQVPLHPIQRESDQVGSSGRLKHDQASVDKALNGSNPKKIVLKRLSQSGSQPSPRSKSQLSLLDISEPAQDSNGQLQLPISCKGSGLLVVAKTSQQASISSEQLTVELPAEDHRDISKEQMQIDEDRIVAEVLQELGETKEQLDLIQQSPLPGERADSAKEPRQEEGSTRGFRNDKEHFQQLFDSLMANLLPEQPNAVVSLSSVLPEQKD